MKKLIPLLAALALTLGYAQPVEIGILSPLTGPAAGHRAGAATRL